MTEDPGGASPRKPPFTNAFAPGFLACMAAFDQPAGAGEADTAGPWRVEPVAGEDETGWAVLRRWESTAQGDRPRLVAVRRDDALYAVAALPAAGRGDLYRLDPEPDEDGCYPLREHERPVARLAHFETELASAMHVLRVTGRSPEALAAFLEAVGHDSLAHAGRLLARHLLAEEEPS